MDQINNFFCILRYLSWLKNKYIYAKVYTFIQILEFVRHFYSNCNHWRRLIFLNMDINFNTTGKYDTAKQLTFM